MEDLIPTVEAARILRRTVTTIARWVREGQIEPALKGPGTTGAMFFRRDVIEAKRAEEDAKYEPVEQGA